MDIETEDFATTGYIKTRLTVMSFMQFFVWGSWLITIGNYWFGNKHWNATEFGAIFTTMGISSVFMPSLMGMLADKWINTERLYAILHVLSGISLLFLPWAGNPTEFFWVILLAMIFYMPTISLSNAVSYSILSSSNLNVVKSFPPIRVWGTIGFIAAMWFTNLTGNKASVNQFYFAGIASFILAGYALSLPKCPPSKQKGESKSIVQTFGLDAFKLLANYKMLLFFLSSLMLGAALQLTNMYGDTYLDFFKYFPKYADSFSVKYSTIIMSISQVSETLFILAIPFFLSKFGIKKVMLISMIAWVLRFGLLSFGNPTDGLWMIIVSCIVYGMAFDFFNISGSLFVNSNVPKENRASAQGLFMMMTNGFGAILGSSISGILIDKYFTLKFTTIQTLSAYFEAKATDKTIQELLNGNEVLLNGALKNPVLIKDWSPIWLTFAVYALIVTVLFALLFKHKHDPKALMEVSH
jgi:NHS family xanthosine MFS transporter